MQENNEDLTLKEEMLNLIEELREDGFNFDEDAAIFLWSYEENPDIVFELSVYDKKFLGEEGEEPEIPPSVLH